MQVQMPREKALRGFGLLNPEGLFTKPLEYIDQFHRGRPPALTSVRHRWPNSIDPDFPDTAIRDFHRAVLYHRPPAAPTEVAVPCFVRMYFCLLLVRLVRNGHLQPSLTTCKLTTRMPVRLRTQTGASLLPTHQP